ncbi:hypothetical protein J4423_02125 [Candidatus Pacearchaeota archaeon]|nr:hypothetical protein [Candidatus Pacearchaeota archaeon]
MTYREELFKAMDVLGQDERTVFLGQCVVNSGTFMYHTLKNIPLNKRLEMPVFEDTQMGMSIGLALAGYVPVSVFPRMDFLICATNQIANHLDKFVEMSAGQFNPRVIVRTAVGSTNPLFPGPQHCNDYCDALRHSVRNIDIVQLKRSEEIVPAYRKALDSNKSTVLVEYPDLYDSS